jgi:ATP-dependent DNA helicase DinG
VLPSQALGPTGPFVDHLPGFQARSAQQSMAESIADAIATRGQLLCEAGTGTGKTFAYLVPALLAGTRCLISTATKTLQDQLFEFDLPLVQLALGTSAVVAVLKGRSNYVCHHRLAHAQAEPSLWPEDHAHLGAVEAWARTSHRGDIAELAQIPEDAAIWPHVTSTVDNCLGQTCPAFDVCFVVKARRAAAAAEVVVINHHLLFADMALREEGFGEILPAAQLVVVDEAHQLPELAAHAFGQAVSSRQLRELARDSVRALLSEAPDMPDARDAIRTLEAIVQEAQIVVGRLPGRHDHDAVGQVQDPTVFTRTAAALEAVVAQLALAAERGPELDNCARRGLDLQGRLASYLDPTRNDTVRWLESSPRGFVLHVTPVDVAEQFSARLARYPAAWVFCSATLAIDGDFAHFQRELGLDAAPARAWPSPFDYPSQALLYLPPVPVAPSSQEYLPAVVETAVAVITASRGRAFVLCTSYRALEFCAAPLRRRLNYPVLVQGEAPRGVLLEEFKRLGNAVLIGTATFWEGVDVRGEALSCVVIDKLPFAPPDDPLLRARVRRMEDNGLNAFRDYQVPVAALTLKQGAGRLIRDITDRGVLVVCDPRLKTKSYGRTFLRALPPMRTTRELADVQAFFESDNPFIVEGMTNSDRDR